VTRGFEVQRTAGGFASAYRMVKFIKARQFRRMLELPVLKFSLALGEFAVLGDEG
jgi:hypothetical protein